MPAITSVSARARAERGAVATNASNTPHTFSSFGPHLVISSQPADAIPGVDAWFTLSPEPNKPSEFRLGERRRKYINPDLGFLEKVVEDVSYLVWNGRDPAVL